MSIITLPVKGGDNAYKSLLIILLLEPSEPHRLTPHKFIMAHARASFGPTGRLLHVLPNSPHDGQLALVEIVDIGELMSQTPEADRLRQFPGPLVR